MSLLAECKYDSDKMGTQSPISCGVAGVTIYNVDLANTSSLTHLVLKEMSSADVLHPKCHDSSSDLLTKSFEVLVPKLLKLNTEKTKHTNLKRHIELSQKP